MKIIKFIRRLLRPFLKVETKIVFKYQYLSPSSCRKDIMVCEKHKRIVWDGDTHTGDCNCKPTLGFDSISDYDNWLIWNKGK